MKVESLARLIKILVRAEKYSMDHHINHKVPTCFVYAEKIGK